MFLVRNAISLSCVLQDSRNTKIAVFKAHFSRNIFNSLNPVRFWYRLRLGFGLNFANFESVNLAGAVGYIILTISYL